jgi:hypothetical protein
MEHLVYEMQRPSTDGSAATAPAIPKVGSAVEKALLVLLWLIVGGPMLWASSRPFRTCNTCFNSAL